MKKIVIALAMGITAISSMAATSMKFTVNGMVCSFCAQGIEKSLSKMGATKEVFVDLKKKTVAVEAKDGQVLDAKAISAEIVDAGYDVVKIETIPQTVAQFRTQQKDKK